MKIFSQCCIALALLISAAVAQQTNVGGYEFQASSVPTVSTSALSAGEAAASLQSVSIGSTNSLSGILTQIGLESVGGETTGIVVYIWSKNPVATTCTAGSNFSASQSDNKYIVTGMPQLLTPSTVLSAQDTHTYAAASNLVGNFVNASGNTNFYYCAVANASVTLSSSSDLRFTFYGTKDQP